MQGPVRNQSYTCQSSMLSCARLDNSGRFFTPFCTCRDDVLVQEGSPAWEHHDLEIDNCKVLYAISNLVNRHHQVSLVNNSPTTCLTLGDILTSVPSKHHNISHTPPASVSSSSSSSPSSHHLNGASSVGWYILGAVLCAVAFILLGLMLYLRCLKQHKSKKAYKQITTLEPVLYPAANAATWLAPRPSLASFSTVKTSSDELMSSRFQSSTDSIRPVFEPSRRHSVEMPGEMGFLCPQDHGARPLSKQSSGTLASIQGIWQRMKEEISSLRYMPSAFAASASLPPTPMELMHSDDGTPLVETPPPQEAVPSFYRDSVSLPLPAHQRPPLQRT